MTFDPVSALRRDGAKAWTRYLIKSQGGDVRWLDRTLLLPTTDRSGVLSGRLAPRVFQDIHEHGKNPDGKYWREFDDSGGKFNLFERVCERVPSSREWLLRDFVCFVESDPPPLLDTRTKLLTYVNERHLLFLPRRAESAIRHLAPATYQDIERRCMRSLTNAATPSTLLMITAFLHEITWRRHPRKNDARRVAEKAIDEFLESFATRQFFDAEMLSISLRPSLYWAVSNIAIWGDRCAPAVTVRKLDELPSLPFLMEDDQEMIDACDCLHAAGECFYERIGQQLPPRYQDTALEGEIPSKAAIDMALRTVKTGVLATHLRIQSEYHSAMAVRPSSDPPESLNSGPTRDTKTRPPR